MNIFEQASRKGLMILTAKGYISVEDLWDLPLLDDHKLDLNDVAKILSQKLREASEENFVTLAGTPAENEDNSTALAFDIVKHIIDVKLKERNVAAEAVIKREKKKKIMEAIMNKETSQLAEASIDDLRSMLEAL